MIFFDEYHIFFTSWAFVSQLRLSSEELGNRLQTPTLIGCKFLMIHRKAWTDLSSYLSFRSLHCDQRSLEFYHAFCELFEIFFVIEFFILSKQSPRKALCYFFQLSLTLFSEAFDSSMILSTCQKSSSTTLINFRRICAAKPSIIARFHLPARKFLRHLCLE